MRIIAGYYNPEVDKFYKDKEYTDVIPPSQKYRYKDKVSGMLYAWNGRRFLDNSFYADFSYVDYNGEKIIETNRIYLAAPGHRILGAIPGIDDDSCSLTVKLNNTNELSFTVNRIVDGYVSPYYAQITRHYELYVQGYGWFKIVDEPEIDNDGTVEKKEVSAESCEIELQQYDLTLFYINTGEEFSKEMLATDNTYEYNEYYAFHDQVRFYWDTTELEEAIEEFVNTDGSVEALREFVRTHTFLIHQPSETNPGINTGCWRITRDEYGIIQIDATHASTKAEQEQGIVYPDYTGSEILAMELKREHELSLLWLVLHEHGWDIGFVDPYFIEHSTVADDTVRLADKVYNFQVDSQDCYSFITQDLAQSFRCIFIFDTENYLVSCYNINNVGYDTHIFFSYRNIQNELTRTMQENLYTVFHVQGSDGLDFTEVNFGEDWIEDITFFLNEKHFSKEFIQKYKDWQIYREVTRPQFMALSNQLRDANDKAKELYNRVPVDSINGNQYSTMSEEELFAERENMIALKTGIEEEFTDDQGNIDMEALMESSEWPQYHALVDVILSYPDPENTIYQIYYYTGPIDESDPYDRERGRYRFPDEYLEEYPDAQLGDIDIAILNHWIVTGHFTDDQMPDEEILKRINVSNQKKYLDDYLYDFDTYGHMYGVKELEHQSQTLFNSFAALTTMGVDPETGDIYDEEAFNKWRKYKDAYDSCQEVLAERKEEYQDALDDLEEIQTQRTALVEDAAITNSRFGFTDEELALLDKYRIHTDYVNNNILITSQSTNEEIVHIEDQLYYDAQEQLYVESHPQYNWSITQDNLLLMPQFANWHGELHVGNYVWITFREDYSVKLRIAEISLNPLMIDSQIQIGFTTMTHYKSKRNDYTDLLARANASTKNQITAAIHSASNRENTINVDTALVLQLLQSAAFSNYTSAIKDSTTYDINDIIARAELRGDQITSGTVGTSRLNVPEIISSGTSSIQSIISGSKISDNQINFMLEEDQQGDYYVVLIPSGSSDTFGTTLADIINALVLRIKDLEDRVSDLEDRVSDLEQI